MKGRCMCGAVTFDVSLKESAFHACHCEMCRRWTGSALLAASAEGANVVFAEGSPVKTIQSSPWAERGWCDKCGSNLFYRVTAEGLFQDTYHLSLGTLDEIGDLSFESEIYFDRKPAVYSFGGERRTVTKAEVEAMFSGDPE